MALAAATLTSSSTDVLTESPPAPLDLNAIEREMAEIVGRMNLLHRELVGLVESTLNQNLLQGCGYVSPAQWLAIWTGLAPERCRQIVRAAQAAADFPCTLAQLGSGAITFDQAMTVISAAPSWAEAEASRMVQWATVSQMRRILGRYNFGDDPRLSSTAGTNNSTDTDSDPDSQPEPDTDNGAGNSHKRRFEEYLRLLQTEDGTWSLHGRLGPEAGLLLDAALREACDALESVPSLTGHPVRPTAVAGLVEMSRRSLDAVVDPARADRFRIYLHLNATTGQFTDPYGMHLPAAVASTLACEAEIRSVHYDKGIPVSVGTTRRTVPSHTRRLILHRDQGCRVPGCTARTHLHVHHIIEWSRGGTTDTGNLISLCGAHHQHLHHGRLRITGPPGHTEPVNADRPHEVRFLTDRGRVLGFHPLPPPSLPAPAPPVRFQHPSGERYDPWSVHFNLPPALRGRM